MVAGLPAPAPARPEHAAGRSLGGFIGHTMPDYEWCWYHRLWCRTLDAFVAGDVRRLMVFAPPRHGKSEIVSRRLPAYVLGRNPDAQVIACSYSAGLAGRMSRDVQRVIDGPAYADVFPGTRLAGRGDAGRWTRTSDLFEVVGRRGSYRAAGVGGSIVGMGFDVGIIDDPIKSQEQALSQTMRDKVWEWYTSDFLTRQHKGARILLTLTRWHVDDLAGRLLKLQADDPRLDRWHVLRFPARAEDPPADGDSRAPGTPLWPERFGEDFLAQMQASLGSYQFSALYRQSPIPAEGGLFKAGWFGRFRDLGDGYRLQDGTVWPRSMCWHFSVLDPATGKNHLTDFTALASYAVTPDRKLLVLEVCRERVRLEGLAGWVKAAVERHGADFLLVEANGFQITVVTECRKVMKTTVREVLPEGKSKLVRALPAIAKAEAGEVYLPAPEPAWVGPYLEELGNWTGQDGDRDDQVDVTSYGVREVAGKNRGMEAVDVPKRPAGERRGSGFGRDRR